MWCKGLWSAVLAGVLVLVGVMAADAGPWPRGQGQWFVAPEFSLNRGDAERQLRWQVYMEHGLAADWVLGAKLEQDGGWQENLRASAMNLGRSGTGAEVFVRYHPGLWADSTPWGMELALRSLPGSGDMGRNWQPRAALHLGRGFPLQRLQVWTRLSLDAAPGRGGHGWDWGGMAQAGLDLPDLGLVWLSAGISRTDGTVIRRLTLQGGYRITEATTLTLGYSQTFGTWREQGLRLGLWREF
ncbi:hypothetical protein HUK65_17640 [Rhodobacteraceae bacterium 2376]|uniref:Cellulose biosynthesis protein BcsS n=1 Tax=Rhabdonatronobacter sediminivivens TaxID=2743469 RepID=A0A7Z0I3H8_9RHOB|nr:hypothetical protein [Rhabdonatronobacter sediminivivens]NYS26792.1 hypothetical protein [Rhabdonatronobacter sediminivivens]